MKGKIRVATCQFAETFSAPENAAKVLRAMRSAKKAKAELVHFHEAALSGYLAHRGAPAPEKVDWDALRLAVEAVCAEAKMLGLWVVLGSAHKLTPPHKPTNCLYLIGPDGTIHDRYDKRFCTGGDLKAYTAGNRFVIFTLNGVKCALLICYDLRFPELYRELKKQGVQAIFQSFHNGYTDGPGIHTHIMRQTVQAHAGINFFWISANNSSGYYSRWPSVFIQPDGFIARSLPFNRPGMMVNVIDTTRDYYDASAAYRDVCMRGVLHSGKLVNDPLQKQTRELW
jgi:deaminated glutathione amidase